MIHVTKIYYIFHYEFLCFSLCAGYISGILQGKSQDECVAIGLRAATSALLSQSPVPKEFIVN